MYCPVCGVESTQGLNYCKRCGTNLSGTPNPTKTLITRPPRFTGAAWAVSVASTAVALGGLGIVFGATLELLREPFQPGKPTALIAGLMVAFGSITVFGTVALLIRLFSRLLGLGSEAVLPAQNIRPPYAGDYKPAQISGPPRSMSSVTEQTTRNFDPALYRDRES